MKRPLTVSMISFLNALDRGYTNGPRYCDNGSTINALFDRGLIEKTPGWKYQLTPLGSIMLKKYREALSS